MRCCSLMLAALTAVAQTPLAKSTVVGAQRFGAGAILAASGLRSGEPVTQKDLDAATQRLFETGLFASVKYKYQPEAPGIVLTWEITEEPPTLPVRLDFPNIEERKLWNQLQSTNSLIGEEIPDNENATAYYRRAIQDALAKLGQPQEVTGKTEGDFATGKLLMIFRPASVAKVGELRFEGNEAVDSSTLASVMSVVAKGQDYSERQFRQMLELNVKPLYEERGFLTVAFPRISATGNPATVSTSIDEGPQWTLGRVQISGDAIPMAEMRAAATFPEGNLANWKQVLESIAEMEKTLKSEGYLKVTSNPVRTYRQDARVVDLQIEVQKGPQFVFGELQIEGIGAGTRSIAEKLWQLRAGSPMNEPYVSEYLQKLSASGIAFKSVGINLQHREATNIVDVILTLR